MILHSLWFYTFALEINTTTATSTMHVLIVGVGVYVAKL
jgi:hypothetical protein